MFKLIWINNTVNGEPTEDFVEFKDGTMLYGYQARAWAAVYAYFVEGRRATLPQQETGGE